MVPEQIYNVAEQDVVREASGEFRLRDPAFSDED